MTTSIKLKMVWVDSNEIIEGVRIYKSASSFTSLSKPAVYAEILDGSDFYEDFNVEDGETYFYMLSCFLGDQEVFTECFEVTPALDPILTFNLPKVNTLISETQIYAKPDLTVHNFLFAFFNHTGESFYIGKPGLSSNGALKVSKCICDSPFDIPASPVFADVDLSLTGRSVTGISFYKNGKRAIVSFSRNSTREYCFAILELADPFDLVGAVVLGVHVSPLQFYSTVMASEPGDYLFIVREDSPTNKYPVVGDLDTSFTLGGQMQYLLNTHTNADVMGYAISPDGLSSIVIFGNLFTSQIKSITSMRLATPFVLLPNTSQQRITRGTAAGNYRRNNTNRFLYKHEDTWFVVWCIDADSNPKVFKQIVEIENWI
ncbi:MULTISPECIES: hypothetical protein [Acinetobacter]|uniref:hypothetical protein n=1 Tax=Acinetobacter TaxID=469 RepID=UPI0002CFCF34|nr:MULTISPECIES: hypothetical protein [Acinetobacter]ENW90562.1 hypothetical protein F905_00585 [Acinetobacter sp. CIP 53.82]MBA0154521.1 hypothetical protein [Acinetobacter indicus]